MVLRQDGASESFAAALLRKTDRFATQAAVYGSLHAASRRVDGRSTTERSGATVVARPPRETSGDGGGNGMGSEPGADRVSPPPCTPRSHRQVRFPSRDETVPEWFAWLR